jgi:rhodanese-related sulfurtransferase
MMNPQMNRKIVERLIEGLHSGQALVDVRSQEAFAKEHIQGTTSLPLSQLSSRSRIPPFQLLTKNNLD